MCCMEVRSGVSSRVQMDRYSKEAVESLDTGVAILKRLLKVGNRQDNPTLPCFRRSNGCWSRQRGVGEREHLGPHWPPIRHVSALA